MHLHSYWFFSFLADSKNLLLTYLPISLYLCTLCPFETLLFSGLLVMIWQKNFFQFTIWLSESKKLVKWQKFKTALCDLTKKASQSSFSDQTRPRPGYFSIAEKIRENNLQTFFHFTVWWLKRKKLVKWQKFKTALCDLTKKLLQLNFVSMQFWTDILQKSSNQSGSQIHAWILLKKNSIISVFILVFAGQVLFTVNGLL